MYTKTWIPYISFVHKYIYAQINFTLYSRVQNGPEEGYLARNPGKCPDPGAR
jgi:hypothetical protein